MKRTLDVVLEDDPDPQPRPRPFDVRLRLTWHDPQAEPAMPSEPWKQISRNAKHQCDDAAQWPSPPRQLPLYVECSAREFTVADEEKGTDAQHGPWTLRWRTTHNVLSMLAPPINRPRCELAAVHIALATLFRRWHESQPVWPVVDAEPKSVVHKIYCLQPSAYVAAHATPGRLRTWKKRRYRTIANQDLWQQVEGAFFRVGDAVLEFYEWPARA